MAHKRPEDRSQKRHFFIRGLDSGEKGKVRQQLETNQRAPRLLLTILRGPPGLHSQNPDGGQCSLHRDWGRDRRWRPQKDSLDLGCCRIDGRVHFRHRPVSKRLPERKTIYQTQLSCWWEEKSNHQKKRITQIDSSRFRPRWGYCSDCWRYGDPRRWPLTRSQLNYNRWKCHDRGNRSDSQKYSWGLYQKEIGTWEKWRKERLRQTRGPITNPDGWYQSPYWIRKTFSLSGRRLFMHW